MSTISDALSMAKKILFVTEGVDRLHKKIEKLSDTVTEHEHRLIRIETTIEIAQQGSRLTLPGN